MRGGFRQRLFGILLLGGYYTAIPATRMLGRAGHTVIVGREENNPTFAELSRYASAAWDHPKVSGNWDEFVDALVGFLHGRPDITVIFPIGDLQLLPLARHHDKLPNHVRVVMPTPEIVVTCENKIRLMRLSSDIGVEQTPYALVSGRDALFAEADRIGYPCVVKAADSQSQLFGKKALICRSAAELRAAIREWPEECPELIVQGFAHGQRHNIHLAARAGRILCSVQIKILRTDRADGTGIGVEGVTVALSDVLNRQCEKLVAALNLTGIGLIQFHYDEARARSHLLEINPRLGANFTVTATCGFDLPNLAVKLALDEPIAEPVKGSYRSGKRSAWTFGDLAGLKYALSTGEIGPGGALIWLLKALVTGLRAGTHVTWSWSDPLPTLATYAQPVGWRLARLFGR
jgi:predicted ATP-grasp superfamily ATP-dependent carboligase